MLRQDDRKRGAPQLDAVHEGRDAGRQNTAQHVFRRPGRDSRGVRADIAKTVREDQPPVPDRHRGLPAGQAAHARVSLRLPRQVRAPLGLRTDPDGHGQQLHGAVGRQPRGPRPPTIESGIRGRKKELAGVGQTQRPHTGALQARMRGRWYDRFMLEMLLRTGRQEEIQHEGHVQAAKRDHVGPLQTGVAWQLRLGGKPRLPHGERADDDVQTGEAGPQRVLRQTLGLPRWRPHRADRVSHGR